MAGGPATVGKVDDRAHSRERSHTPSRPSVLVVDDFELNARQVASVLEREGYEVVIADSGPSALSAFRRSPTDVVLLDALMPGMDGFETCSRLRALPRGAETPIVFFTGLDDPESHEKAMDVGGDDFLLKPIRRAELLIRVRSLMRLKQVTKELQDQCDISRKQAEELRALQRQKDELVALVVHDLKTPLAVLNLDSQFMLGSLSDLNAPEEVRECVDGIRDTIQKMRRLVLDLLDIGRAESGALVLRRGPVDLRVLVERVASAMQRSLAEKHQRLELKVEPAVIHADGELLRRVIVNLVDYACLYSEEHGVVVIEARVAGGAVKLEVVDQGPGIPPESRAIIFEKYVQIGERRHRYSRGLGLAFCKLAIEAHGGRISIESNEPTGARFCIDLAADVAPRGSLGRSAS
jgi:signal transduction histidine kinase